MIMGQLMNNIFDAKAGGSSDWYAIFFLASTFLIAPVFLSNDHILRLVMIGSVLVLIPANLHSMGLFESIDT